MSAPVSSSGPVPVPALGARIRTLRLQRELSLRALARAVGVSASLISQIETGKSQPSVSTLYAITQALGTSIEDVFEAEGIEDAGEAKAGEANAGEADDISGAEENGGAKETDAAEQSGGAEESGGAGKAREVSRERPGPTASAVVAEALLPTPGHGTAPLVRPAEREVLRLESGVTWERLGHVPGTHVDFLLVTYAPGGSSSGTGHLMRHTGVEHGYLIEGELTLTLGFDEYLLRAGDATSFPSGIPHRYRNEGERPAVGVWFVFANDALWPRPDAPA
jgi:transcriptional regulator with XRE-family HTH domain/quercetin dioxygenase-like cupin family protein